MEEKYGFLTEQQIEEVLSGNAKVMVERAKTTGENLKKVSASQIRNIFGTVKKLQLEVKTKDKKLSESTKHKLYLLIPRVYYAARRSKKEEMEKFRIDIENLINKIEKRDNELRRFFNFCDYIEAITAYHYAFSRKQ